MPGIKSPAFLLIRTPGNGDPVRKDAEGMTDEQKIELIKREPFTVWEDFTPEEQAFLQTAWDDPNNRELYYKVWEQKPGNIEHAVKNAPCTPEELETTSKVLHTIWNYWKETGASKGDLNDYTVLQTLEAMDRKLKHDHTGQS